MKYKLYGILFLLSGVMLGSCSKFIDKSPQDQILSSDYWTQPNDIKLFANQYYQWIPSHGNFSPGLFGGDNNSDNMIPGNFNQRLAGTSTLNNASVLYNSTLQNWDYSRVRSLNYALENYGTVIGVPQQINTYVGELLFFRAYFYFHMVKAYGDIPWVGRTLEVDSDELYAPRTERNIVIDSVLRDLTTAIEYLPLKSSAEANRLNRESAMLFKSRVALFEGTWQKHHAGSSFASDNADWAGYLEIAAQSAKSLIDLSTAGLFEPTDPYNYFKTLFAITDMSANPEILMWKKYDLALGASHSTQAYVNSGGNSGVSKSMVDSYLCTDGLPISTSPLYQGDDNLNDVISGRDPRLVQSIWVPGEPSQFDAIGQVIATFDKPWLNISGEHRNTSGYQLKKGIAEKFLITGGPSFTEGAIIFRYAEALLNYVEAKAELNQLTQEDVDITINKLRERVQMPPMNIGSIPNDPNWQFPDESPVINEIRRERRVELFTEAFRFDDLTRWSKVDILVGKRPRGAKFIQSDFPELQPGSDIYVDEDGYIDPYQVALPNGFQFNLNRDYLIPVPQQELTLNDNLVQNPGWE